ncbi:hypothetical protein, partial [Klebsiella pneumoniae]|uniref:hypothetical protein n=1 Tax=Klebsiella pneumoniae TaxID=573 RepID=UPI001953B1C7
ADFEAAGRDKMKATAGHEVYKLTDEQLSSWRRAAEPLHKSWEDSVKKIGVDAEAAMKELRSALAQFGAAL